MLAKEKAEARADSLQKQVWTFEEDVQNLRKVLISSFITVTYNWFLDSLMCMSPHFD